MLVDTQLQNDRHELDNILLDIARVWSSGVLFLHVLYRE